MTKNYFFAGLAVISAGIFAFQSDDVVEIKKFSISEAHLQSNGGQPGLTGAPGEANCTQCHFGSVLPGDNEIQITMVNSQFQTVTSYTPGSTYTVSVAMASNPDKKGFSATALDPSNNMAGSFTALGPGGTQAFQNGPGTRDYVSHTSTSNTSSTTLWAWTWTAPATNVGDVTFYVAANSANNNNNTTGDQIYLKQQIYGSIAGIEENEEVAATELIAGYNAEANNVTLDFTSLTSEKIFFNLIDMNGKSVYSKDLSNSLIGKNKKTVALPSEVENGMYVATIFVGNKPMTAKILVQK